MTPDELRQRRGALGMSQAQLAAALGITENRYQAWETGRNGIPPFLGLALDALGMPKKRPSRREAEAARTAARKAHVGLLTTAQAAVVLGMTPHGIRGAIRAGRLPATPVPFGRYERYLIAPAACDYYARKHRHEPDPEHTRGRKLDEAQAQAILDSPRGKGVAQDLANTYEITRASVWNIWRRETWKHLTPRFVEE